SETRDKRRRTDLDLFVLALIDSGISTPYDLQKTAALSLGARSRPSSDCCSQVSCARENPVLGVEPITGSLPLGRSS
ncbi:MAG: hypothetical protein WAK33_23900, partial [Silvibacterium sp.]